MNKICHIFPAIIPGNICDNIIERGLKLPSQQATIGFNNDRVEDSYRVGTLSWFYGPENKDIVDLVSYYANFANRESFGFDISFGPYEFQFSEYNSNDGGKYDWHHDVWWLNPRQHDRKLSFVLQLSEPSNYKGGNFELMEPGEYDLSGFKPRGSIIVFPSFFRHRVTKVIEGIRYSLVSWIDGPKFR